MITSESSFDEFRRFFNSHARELTVRLYNLLNKKYKRSIIEQLRKGEDIPNYFGTLKVGDITLYSLPCGLKCQGNEIIYISSFDFLIMKDLREQTRIMVTDIPKGTRFGIVYRTHAISRYKERLGLDPDMDFVDVCKHMCAVGACNSARIIDDFSRIHGSEPNHRESYIMCANGSYKGYFSRETGMHYAETFLSPNELQENQIVLDPTKSESAQQWNEVIKKIRKGEIPVSEWENYRGVNYSFYEDGKFTDIKPSEKEEAFEEYEKFFQENPEYFQAQKEANRARAENRIRRKGYK